MHSVICSGTLNEKTSKWNYALMYLLSTKKTNPNERGKQVFRTWWCRDPLVGIYLFKVNNRNTRIMCEICLKVTIKAPERRQWRHTGLVSLLLTLNRLHTLFWCCHCQLWTNKYRLDKLARFSFWLSDADPFWNLFMGIYFSIKYWKKY